MEKYSFNSPNPQQFSLPRDTMDYILKNPNGLKGYQNLMKSCKYFYFKNPIIFADSITIKGQVMTWMHRNSVFSCVIGKLKCKLWISDIVDFYLAFPPQNVLNKIIFVEKVCLSDHEDLLYDKFLLITNLNGLKSIKTETTYVVHDNGMGVSNPQLRELFPSIKIE